MPPQGLELDIEGLTGSQKIADNCADQEEPEIGARLLRSLVDAGL